MESIKRICLKRKWFQEFEDEEINNFDFTEYDQEPKKAKLQYCGEHISKREFEITGLIETEKAINSLKNYIKENPKIYEDILKDKKIFENANSGLISRIKHMACMSLKPDYLENIVPKEEIEKKLNGLLNGMTQIQNTNKKISLEEVKFRDYSLAHWKPSNLTRPSIRPSTSTTHPNSQNLFQTPTNSKLRKNQDASFENTFISPLSFKLPKMRKASGENQVGKEKSSYLSYIKDGKEKLRKTEVERTPKGTPLTNPSMDPALKHSSTQPLDHATQLTTFFSEALQHKFSNIANISASESFVDQSFDSFTE